MLQIQGIITPPKQLEQRLAAMLSGTIGGAVLTALLTDDESSLRYLKIAAGAVVGLLVACSLC